MYLVRLWNDKGEMETWRVKGLANEELPFFPEPDKSRNVDAILSDGRRIFISPSVSATIIVEEIPDEK